MRKDSNVINILFFIESLSGGGAEKVLRNLVNAMDQTKFCITVQTLYPDDAGKYLAPGIRYRYCYPAKNRINELRMRAEAAAGLTYRYASRVITISRLPIWNAVQRKLLPVRRTKTR